MERDGPQITARAEAADVVASTSTAAKDEQRHKLEGLGRLLEADDAELGPVAPEVLRQVDRDWREPPS